MANACIDEIWLNDYLNDLVENTCDCWDEDSDGFTIALLYLRHLEREVVRLGGTVHKFDECPNREWVPNVSP